MNAKKELRRYLYLDEYKKIKQREYDEALELGTHITQVISDMPIAHGLKKSKVEDCAVRLATISEERLEMLLRTEEERLRIEKKIDQVSEPYRAILVDIYIKGMSLKEIARDRKRNYTYVSEQHERALREYEKK